MSEIEKWERLRFTLEYCALCRRHYTTLRLWFCPFFEPEKWRRDREIERERFKVVEMIYIIIFDDDRELPFLWFLRIRTSFFFLLVFSHSSMLFSSYFSFCSLWVSYALLVFIYISLVSCTFRPFTLIQKASIMPCIIYYRVHRPPSPSQRQQWQQQQQRITTATTEKKITIFLVGWLVGGSFVVESNAKQQYHK